MSAEASEGGPVFAEISEGGLVSTESSEGGHVYAETCEGGDVSAKASESVPILAAVHLPHNGRPGKAARCLRMVAESARKLQPKPQASILKIKSKFCAVK